MSNKTEEAMREAAEEFVAKIMAQRQEILAAFIAKYGCSPEEAVQIQVGNRWKVERIGAHEREKMRKAIIKERAITNFVNDARKVVDGIERHVKDTPSKEDRIDFTGEEWAAWLRLSHWFGGKTLAPYAKLAASLAKTQ